MVKRKKISIFFVLSYSIALITLSSFAIILSKNRQNTIHYISSEAGLRSIENNMSGHYVLDVDSSLSLSDDWIPIGDENHPFTGILDCNYNAIVGKGFDNDYIVESIEKYSKVFLGLFVKNSGIIKHLSISFSKTFDNDSIIDRTEKNYSVVFGTVCAINDGYISMCSVPQMPSITQKDQCSDILYGGITGINYKQVRCCETNNALAVSGTNKVVCGGLIGINYENTVVEYCLRKGFSWVTSRYGNLICGQAIGMSFGGTINNISITSPEISDDYKCYHYFSCVSGCCGGLIGLATSDNIKISYININVGFEIKKADSLKFGIIVGLYDSSVSFLTINNVVLSCELINQAASEQTFSCICCGGNNIVTNDIYSYGIDANIKLLQKELITMKDFSELSISLSGFD